jgi:hypothetical protein
MSPRDVNLCVRKQAGMPRVEIKFFAIFLSFSSRLAIWMGNPYVYVWKSQNPKEKRKKVSFINFITFVPSEPRPQLRWRRGKEPKSPQKNGGHSQAKTSGKTPQKNGGHRQATMPGARGITIPGQPAAKPRCQARGITIPGPPNRKPRCQGGGITIPDPSQLGSHPDRQPAIHCGTGKPLRASAKQHNRAGGTRRVLLQAVCVGAFFFISAVVWKFQNQNKRVFLKLI